MGRKISKLSHLAGLRARLLLLVLVAIIPALGLILYSAAQQRQLVTSNIQNQTLELARFVSEDQSNLIDQTHQLLAALAYYSDMSGDASARCAAYFSFMLEQGSQYANLGVAQPNGDISCSAIPVKPSVNIANLDFFQRTLKTGQFTVGNYAIDQITGQVGVNFGYPIFDTNGRVQSVVFATVNLDGLNRIIANARLYTDTSMMLINRQGVVLLRTPDPQHWSGRSVPDLTLIKSMLGHGEGTLDTIDLDGTRRLFAFTPLQIASNNDMVLSIGVDKNSAFAQANQIMLNNLIGLGIVAILALTAAWLGGDWFVLRHVRALLKTTRALMEGDLNARTGLSYNQGELGQLAEVFDQMMERLGERENERKQAELTARLHHQDLSALNNITAAINTTLELPEIYNTLKDGLVGQMGIPGGVIYSYEESIGSLCLEATWGLPKRILNQLRQFPATAYHYHHVFRQKEVIFIPYLQEVEPYASCGLPGEKPEWAGYVCVPLITKGEIVGIIDLFNFSPASLSEDKIGVFKAIGQQAGSVIQNARLFEQIRDGRERMRILSHEVLEAQEVERRHISRELHDEIGQALTALKVNLQSIGKASNTINPQSSLEESISIIDRTINQVRALSLDLRPSLLDDLGVVSAIRWYVDRQAQRGGFKATFTSTPPEIHLSSDLETTCFRLVQEAITNVVRHAQADTVEIEIHQSKTDLELYILDDGVGFDVDATSERNASDASLGLVGMKERVELIGGILTIRSNILNGRGTEIKARFPLKHNFNYLERRTRKRELL
jgi:signal transduction histidine kinase